jgi:hypothetical protein
LNNSSSVGVERGGVGERDPRPRVRVASRKEVCPRCLCAISTGSECLDVIHPRWVGAITVHRECRKAEDHSAGPPTRGSDTCAYCDGWVEAFPYYNDLGELCHEACETFHLHS